MKQEEIMKKNLLDEIKNYFYQTVYLDDLDKVYKDIIMSKSKLENAPNFTLIIEASLMDNIISTLARLYDKSNNSNIKTIPNLIGKCRKHIDFFPDKEGLLKNLDEFEKKLEKENTEEEIKLTIEYVLYIRDKILAHNDKKYFGDKIFNEIDKKYSKIKNYNIWFLIEFTKNAVNYLFSQLSSDEKLQTKYDGDLQNLFR